MAPFPDSMNPLLQPLFRIPFDRIRACDIEPAADSVLAAAREQIDRVANSDHPLRVLDRLAEPLEYAMRLIHHLNHVVGTGDFLVARQAVDAKASAFYSDIYQNQRLWEFLQSYASTEEASLLTGEARRYLELTLTDFRRHGAALDAEEKLHLQQLDRDRAVLRSRFLANIAEATKAWELVVTEEWELKGLPDSALAAAWEAAARTNRKGWRLTLEGNCYMAVMTYADDDRIREQLWRAYNTRAAGGAYDNRPVIAGILQHRQERARLLGYGDFAELVVSQHMAGSANRVWEFLSGLRRQLEPEFQRENRELEAFAGRKLQPWDIAYWAEKQRKALYEFDEEWLRPYFVLPKVIEGMFSIFGEMLGIAITEEPDMPTWAPEVKCYAIHDADTGEHLGSFYADWHARENKRGGAWMNPLLTGYGGQPHLAVICGNLARSSSEGGPVLLTHAAVRTIFHEFGHLLHHVLSRVEYRSLSSANVAVDFLEMPSRLLEQWCWERAALDRFARHYETGATIPEELLRGLERARGFRTANARMRPLGFAVLDQALHRYWDGSTDIVAYSRALLQDFMPAPLPDDYAMVTSYPKLFSSPMGPGAGFYFTACRWAEGLAAAVFGRFKEGGIFNQQIGRSLRERVLARGAAEEPATLLRDFMSS